MSRRFNKLHFCIAIGLLLFIWIAYYKYSTLQTFYSDTKIFLDRVSSVSTQFNNKCDEDGECDFDDDGEDNNNFQANLNSLRTSVNALPLGWAVDTLLPPPLQLTIKPNQTVALDWSNEEDSETILANNVIFESKSSNSALRLTIDISFQPASAPTALRCNSGESFQLATSLSLKPVITLGCETINANRSSNDACVVRFEDLSADLTRYRQCQTK